MIVKRFFEPLLAQTSYLIGCSAAGEAIVIDPNRDADQYVAAAAAHGLRISHVTETHIHADFVSGSRELAARTGATMLLSAEGGPDWSYDFISEARPLAHGDRITIGNVSLDVVHTPGHTPEHLTFLDHRRRGRQSADRRGDRRLHLRRRRRPAGSAREGRPHEGDDGSGRPDAVPQSPGVQSA